MNTDMETVFRIQDVNGRGPYKPGFSRVWLDADHEEAKAHLVPWFEELGRVDRLALYGSVVGCGCVSVEQLRGWFTPSEYGRLVGHGYRAVKMDRVRILAQSSIQCVFERAGALSEGVEPFELYSRVEASDA